MNIFTGGIHAVFWQKQNKIKHVYTLEMIQWDDTIDEMYDKKNINEDNYLSL